jgi:UDP-N-acetylmuramyl-tripeptide synthetase
VPKLYNAGRSSSRLIAIFVVSTVLFIAVMVRVALLQTVQADSLRSAGKSQRTTELVLKARRGSIFDRDGVDLALSVPTRTITANPKLVTDPAGTATTLASLLGLPETKRQALTEAFTAKTSSFVYVARQIDSKLATSVMALNLAGVLSMKEDKRILPSGDVARSIVGRTDPDGIGTAGLEVQYDDILRGVDGELSREHDRKFRSIAGGSVTVAPEPGSDVVTTLKRSLQYQVEQELLRRVDELSAYGGTAIVMGTKPGDVYAVANVRRNSAGRAEVTSADLAATEPHEPGSVAKVFSIAAAVNENLVTPETTMMVPGSKTFNAEDKRWKKTIRDAEPHPPRSMDLRYVIVHSSNIGTIMMTEGLGATRFGKYLHNFGFGSSTGLGLPDESSGIMKPAAEWQATEKVTPRFGYGYSATSLQLIAAVNTIANNGTYVAPRLVLSTIDSKGETHNAPPSPTREVVTPESAATMTSMMRDVVCYGTAKAAKVPGMSVAGKTGTTLLKPPRTSAQDGSTTPGAADYEGTDGKKEYYSTFVGYFPADNPQVTILVSIDRPNPASQDHLGGKAAGPLFSRLATIAMHELHVSPSPDDSGCQNAEGGPMQPRTLRVVVEQAGLDRFEVVGSDLVEIRSIEFDSRRVRPGSLFCCLKGEHSDGHEYARAAHAAGATALLVEHRVDVDVAQVLVADSRQAMGLLAAAVFGHPSRAVTMVGITGTNGKTTTTSLVASILSTAGRRTGTIGTLTGIHTTPESPDLQARLAEFVEQGMTAVVMEVSSHALALRRVAGCHFDLAVFTNLGRDHLDLHGTPEQYFAAKALLFRPELADAAVVNIDDTHGRLLRDAADIPTAGFSMDDVSDVLVTATSHAYRWHGQLVEVPLGGDFNVMNSLAAATACASLGVDDETIVRGLAGAGPVPGRFEAVVAGQPFAVIVDYAHTPDGLEQAIGAARRIAGDAAVHVVFGCGGDRDREKRPLMGAVTSRLADHVVVTSDNPRSEDPLEIINATMEGVTPDYRGRVVMEPDRRRAIEIAVRQARAGDVVLIAGKGHELTQTIGNEIIEFDDRAVARSVLETLA